MAPLLTYVSIEAAVLPGEVPRYLLFGIVGADTHLVLDVLGDNVFFLNEGRLDVLIVIISL